MNKMEAPIGPNNPDVIAGSLLEQTKYFHYLEAVSHTVKAYEVSHLKRAFNPLGKDEGNFNKLCYDIDKGDLDMLKYDLSQHPQLLDAQNNDGKTLLMLAVDTENPDSKIVKLLLDKGAKVDIQDNYGTTALMISSKIYIDAQKDITKLLISKQPDTSIKDDFGLSAEDYINDYIYDDNDKAERLSLLQTLYKKQFLLELKNTDRVKLDAVTSNEMQSTYKNLRCKKGALSDSVYNDIMAEVLLNFETLSPSEFTTFSNTRINDKSFTAITERKNQLKEYNATNNDNDKKIITPGFSPFRPSSEIARNS